MFLKDRIGGAPSGYDRWCSFRIGGVPSGQDRRCSFRTGWEVFLQDRIGGIPSGQDRRCSFRTRLEMLPRDRWCRLAWLLQGTSHRTSCKLNATSLVVPLRVEGIFRCCGVVTHVSTYVAGTKSPSCISK